MSLCRFDFLFCGRLNLYRCVSRFLLLCQTISCSFGFFFGLDDSLSSVLFMAIVCVCASAEWMAALHLVCFGSCSCSCLQDGLNCRFIQFAAQQFRSVWTTTVRFLWFLLLLIGVLLGQEKEFEDCDQTRLTVQGL